MVDDATGNIYEVIPEVRVVNPQISYTKPKKPIYGKISKDDIQHGCQKPDPNVKAKEIKPKVEIINTGLASTTNDMVANSGGNRSRMYSIRDSGLFLSGQDVKVHGFKK